MKEIYPRQEIEQQIGFTYVRDFLLRHCVSEGGKDCARTLSALPLGKQHRQRWEEVQARLALEQAHPGKLNLVSWELLPEDLSKSGIEGFFLSLEELRIIRDFLAQAVRVFRVLNQLEEAQTALLHYAQEPQNLQAVQQAIDKVLGPDGGILWTASPELSKLNRERIRHEEQLLSLLQKEYKSYQKQQLTVDLEPTVKNGRYVIPVQSAGRNTIQGVIQGESAGGNISYIEPMAVVLANNRMAEINYQIDREIEKLLKKLTAVVADEAASMNFAQDKLHQLDLLQAISRYAEEHKACMPKLSSKNRIQLKRCRHPQLETHLRERGEEMNPLDFSFSEQQRLMIISGPNAGGKSVALKAFSLAQYSLQCAIPICAEENSEMMLFDNLLSDIGDNQSMDADLSTYSAHLSAMKAFLSIEKGKTFIAIDEIGAGTDPQLGGPMAEAMIRHFDEAGFYGIITTHFSNLKTLEGESRHIFNASMLYDTEKLAPLFELVTGSPGSSFVFELAKRIGIPRSIIRAAEDHTQGDHQQLEQLLSELDTRQSRLHKAQEELDTKDRRLAGLIKDYERLKAELVQAKKDILQQAKQEASEVLKSANKQIEKTVKHIKERKADKKVVARERKTIQEVRKKIEDEKSDTALNTKTEKKKPHTWKVGDLASIDNQTAPVEIIAIKNQQAELVYNNIRTRIPLKRLYKVDKKTSTPKSQHGIRQQLVSKMSGFKPKIDLRGERESDAQVKLRNYLDDAYSLGVRQISIVHGRGNGALKKMVKQLLKELPYIDSWKHDHADRGGDGATIVALS